MHSPEVEPGTIEPADRACREPRSVSFPTDRFIVFLKECLNCGSPAVEVWTLSAKRVVVPIVVMTYSHVYQLPAPLCATCFRRRAILTAVKWLLLALPLVLFVATVLMTGGGDLVGPLVVAAVAFGLVLMIFVRQRLGWLDLDHVGAMVRELRSDGRVEVIFRNASIAASATLSNRPPHYFPGAASHDEKHAWWVKVPFGLLALAFARQCWLKSKNPNVFGELTGRDAPYAGCEWLFENFGAASTYIVPTMVGVALFAWGAVQFGAQRGWWRRSGRTSG